ncbi:MAG TPA: 16S rRNA (guanine(527)-N(7))-methyltransferase RsmG [Amnibacterium sp.]|nr:16S rRNA (guanine(527)-N(7))-methyltransferase RsmG [Amnibacterium sp.]
MSDPVEPEPAVAQRVFGPVLPLVRRYAADLARSGVELGLIGPLEPARLWTRHLLNCGLVAPLIPHGSTVADVGSGAGLPGLVLAAARPDLRITLIEPMERRVVWLQDEIGRLGLEQVTVRRARAEEVGERFQVVTARAVGALKKLLPVVVPLVEPGGSIALMKGAGVEEEIRAADRVIRRLRLADLRVEIVGTGMASLETRVLVATVPD